MWEPLLLLVHQCDETLRKPIRNEQAGKIYFLHSEGEFSTPHVSVSASTKASTRGLYSHCPALWWAWVWSRLGRSCWLSALEGVSGPAAAAGVPAEGREKPLSQLKWSAQGPSSTESRSGCSRSDRGLSAAAASGSSQSSPRCQPSLAWSWALACETPSPEWLSAARCSCWCDPCAFSPQWVSSSEKEKADK